MATPVRVLRQAALATLGVLVTLLGAYLLYRLRDLLILVVVALIFASAIAPLVDRLNRRLPLGASIGVVYLGLLLTVAALLSAIIPPLAGQTREFIASAPELLRAAEARIASLQGALRIPSGALTPNLEGGYGRLAQNAPTLASGALGVALSFITGIAGVVVVLVAAFYWLLERRYIEGTWLQLVPGRSHREVYEVISEIEAKLGGYVRGQLLLAVIVGLISLVGLLALGVPFALTLALVAGIGEMIPYVGPFIGAVPAVLIALAVSPQRALLVVGLYVLIQQLENHVLVPKVMQHSVGLSPLTVLLSVLAGGALLGIIGVLLAVPVVAAASVVLTHTLLPQQKR